MKDRTCTLPLGRRFALPLSEDGGGTPDDRTGCFLASAFTWVGYMYPKIAPLTRQPQAHSPVFALRKAQGTRDMEAQGPSRRNLLFVNRWQAAETAVYLRIAAPVGWNIVYSIEGCLLGGPTPSDAAFPARDWNYLFCILFALISPKQITNNLS